MARRTIDSGKMSSMVSRPGVDTRVWLTYATITELGFDAEQGMFADVQYIPSGESDTAVVGAPYAGDEFGLWCPLEVGDTVLVAVANGDPNTGPVIVARLWRGGDKPSADMGEGEVPTDNVVLRVRAGKKLVLVTSGEGEVDITAEGSGDIKIKQAGSGSVYISAPGGQVVLGQDTPAIAAPPVGQGVVNGQAYDAFTMSTQSALGNASTAVFAKK